MIELNFSLRFEIRPPRTKPETQTKSAISPECLEEARQCYETFLTNLEALAVKALITGNWDAVYAHIAGNITSQNQNYNAHAIALITRILSDRN